MRALTISGWLTGIYFAVELGIGIWTGSVAVISDTFHTFSAVGGVLIAIVPGRLALRPANRYQTFGLMRTEIVGARCHGDFQGLENRTTRGDVLEELADLGIQPTFLPT